MTSMTHRYMPWFGVLFLLIGFWVFFRVKQSEILDLSNDIIGLEGKISLLKSQMSIQWDSDCTILDPSILMINKNGDTLQLSELVNNLKRSTLFFRFSHTHCQFCVDQEIKNLNEFADRYGNLDVLGFSNYENFGEYRRLTRVKSISFDSYNLITPLNLEIEDLQIPYIFIMTPGNFEAKVLFVPSKDIPDNSNRYYSIINQKNF